MDRHGNNYNEKGGREEGRERAFIEEEYWDLKDDQVVMAGVKLDESIKDVKIQKPHELLRKKTIKTTSDITTSYILYFWIISHFLSTTH